MKLEIKGSRFEEENVLQEICNNSGWRCLYKHLSLSTQTIIIIGLYFITVLSVRLASKIGQSVISPITMFNRILKKLMHYKGLSNL